MSNKSLRIKEEKISLNNFEQVLAVGIVSDPHLRSVKAVNLLEQAVEEVNKRGVDLVFLLGDYITRAKGGVADLKVLGELKSRFGTFAVLGNHDCGAFLPFCRYNPDLAKKVAGALGAVGVTVLRNDSCVVDIGAGKLNILGVDDVWAKGVDLLKTFSGVDLGLSTFLLAHNPDIVLELGKDQRTDLVFCGHTHAGGVRLPLVQAVLCSTKLGRCYDRGLKEYQGRLMYISGGLAGMWCVPRICNPPEITILKIGSRV